jgi:hypothetical protein
VIYSGSQYLVVVKARFHIAILDSSYFYCISNSYNIAFILALYLFSCISFRMSILCFVFLFFILHSIISYTHTPPRIIIFCASISIMFRTLTLGFVRILILHSYIIFPVPTLLWYSHIRFRVPTLLLHS